MSNLDSRHPQKINFNNYSIDKPRFRFLSPRGVLVFTVVGGFGLTVLGTSSLLVALWVGFWMIVLATIKIKQKLDYIESPAVDPLKSLKHQVGKLKFMDQIEIEGEEASRQLNEAAQLFKQFTVILDKKFSRTEITYDRFYGVGQTSFQAICGCLVELSEFLTQLSLIDAKDEDPEKVKLRIDLKQKADGLFSLNQKALVQLNSLTKALIEIKTSEEVSSSNLDSLVGEMAELANRAKLYSK